MRFSVFYLFVLILVCWGFPSVSTTPTPSRSPTRSSSPTRTLSPSSSPTRTLSPSSSPTRTLSPSSSRTLSPSRGPTRTLSPSSSQTTSLSPTPTPRLTPSKTPTRTQTPTDTATHTPTMTGITSPTPTPTKTFSPTPTIYTGSPTSKPTIIFASNSSSPTPTDSTSPTATTTILPVVSLSSTFTPTGTGTEIWDTPTPSNSPTPSIIPSLSPTPSVTPPPFSCLSRVEGCSNPTLSVSEPQLPLNIAGLSLEPPLAIAVASYPFLSATFVLSLPVPPSQGESLTLECSSSVPTMVSLVLKGGGLQPCGGISGGCGTLTLSQLPSTLSAPLNISVVVSPSTPAAVSTSPVLSCTVSSTPLLSNRGDSSTYPRYGAGTSLSSPFSVLPSTIPLFSVALAGFTKTPDLFRGIGGVSGGPWKLPLFFMAGGGGGHACDLATLSIANSTDENSTQMFTPWNSSRLVNCPPAMEAIESLASSLLASPSSKLGPPVFSSILSGSTTVLLMMPEKALFPATSRRNVSITLGGIISPINWVSPNGTVVCITTPPLSALCSGALSLGITFPGSGDCGVASLVFSQQGIGTEEKDGDGGLLTSQRVVQALVSSQPIFIPSVYPPLVPSQFPFTDALIRAASSLVGYQTLPSLLLAANAISPPHLGIRIVPQCIDPSYATLGECAVVNNSQPYLPGGLVCPWGSGDSCVSCPNGALCPGGAQMFPLPGYWAPFLEAPPETLVACPEPEATVRCPGYSLPVSSSLGNKSAPMTFAPSTSACGDGYSGWGCAGCAPNYFASGHRCFRCPESTIGPGLVFPVLTFIGGLMGVGLVLCILLYLSLVLRRLRREKITRNDSDQGAAAVQQLGEGKQPTDDSKFISTLSPVCSVLVWIWIAAQGASSLFIEAQGLAPSVLRAFYGTLAALQFRGISIDPACFSSTPFGSFWYAVGFLSLCAFLIVLCLLSLRYGAAASIFSSPLKCPFMCVGKQDRSLPPLSPISSPSSEAPPSTTLPRYLFSLRFPRTLLFFVFLSLRLGYGAIISIFANALTCNPPVPMLLYNYVGSVSDGRTMRATLGPSAPSMNALRAAAANPLQGPNAALFRLMKSTTLSVSVLSSDPFQVCMEGPHLAVWYVAVTLSVVFTFGFPFLGLVSLWKAGKLKGLRRFLAKRAGGGKMEVAHSSIPEGDVGKDASSVTDPLLCIHYALNDDSLRKEFKWFPYWEMVLLASISGLVGFSHRTLTNEDFYFSQAGIILVTSAAIILLWRVQPFTPLSAWTRMPRAALHGLTALTALINAEVAVHIKSYPAETQLALGVLPLVYAAFLMLVIVSAWWLNGYTFGIKALSPSDWWVYTFGTGTKTPSTKPLKNDSVEDSTSASLDTAYSNPLVLTVTGDLLGSTKTTTESRLPVAVQAPLWDRVFDSTDSDRYWFCSQLGTSLYELPPHPGTKTVCGWEFISEVDGGNGIWKHQPTGVTSVQPPSLIKEEADAMIQRLSQIPVAIVEGGVMDMVAGASTSGVEPMKFNKRAVSVNDKLQAARLASVKARVLSTFARRNSAVAMTELEAVTLLQVRWRQRRASRTKELWKKIHALEVGQQQASKSKTKLWPFRK